ncbi:MAG: MlaA family lipoprotein [Burkholderiales bacterium]
MRRPWRLAVAALAAAALAGCATVRSPDPRDPWEPMNRATFEFNDGVDRVVLRPVAEAYRFVLPEPIRIGVRNVFANLQDPWIALNQLLQGKVEEALSDGWRFIANSSFGLGGIFDIASDMGMPKHAEDFGQTLAVWGVDFGPYLILPILGPSSARDAAGTAVASQMYLPWQLPKWLDVDHRVAWQNALTVVDLIQTRANLLDASNLLEQAALDRYSFLRNAYFQRRRNLIYDGNPPPLPPRDEQSGAAPAKPTSETVVPEDPPPPPGAGPAPQSVDPKVPTNYAAVLAAGERRAAGGD